MSRIEPVSTANDRFPLNESGKRWTIDVRDRATLTIVAYPFGTWSTAVLTVYGSADGCVEGPSLGTLGPTAATRYASYDVIDHAYVIVKETTPEGSDLFARLSVTMKDAAV